jgi:hypothetical protein
MTNFRPWKPETRLASLQPARIFVLGSHLMSSLVEDSNYEIYVLSQPRTCSKLESFLGNAARSSEIVIWSNYSRFRFSPGHKAQEAN